MTPVRSFGRGRSWCARSWRTFTDRGRSRMPWTMHPTMMVVMTVAEAAAEAGAQQATSTVSAAPTLRIIVPATSAPTAWLTQRGDVQGGRIDRDALPGSAAILDAEADRSRGGRSWLECI